jgi:cation diffusion facilitator CzcD-associated flavoprotein CzcO
MTVARLSERVRRDLAYLTYPSREWTVAHDRDGAPVLDVLIVGGGQAGLATAFGLKLEHVDNIRIVDRNPRGLEGPWRRFARMRQLRTPKEVTGIDFGIPSLTIQAWYEAKFGPRAWKRISAIPPEVWRDYLDWYRDVLALPVENNTEVTSIEPAGEFLLAHLRRKSRSERVIARKIVLATGIDGSGSWRAPSALVADLPRERWAHSSDKIDFRRLAGKRVGVLGAGAAGFDNAAVALEAGAASVDLCLRRTELPRVNPLIWTNFAGMLGHFAELDDLNRWRFMRYILEKPPMPPPQETFWRCRKFDNFAWHTDCRWRAVRYDGKAATVETDGDPFTFDFIIFATGFETDLSARPELAPIVRHIARWRDKFTPPPGEESDLLARHPYLGAAFEFTERQPGGAPYLGRLHNYTFGAAPSVGLTGGAITGIKYGVRRLVSGLVRDLFREDVEHYYRDLLAYSDQELESLEAPLAWIDRLASEALGDELIADLLGHVRDRNASRGEPAPQDAKGESKTGSSKRARTRQAAARSRNRPVATKHKKRRRYSQ